MRGASQPDVAVHSTESMWSVGGKLVHEVGYMGKMRCRLTGEGAAKDKFFWWKGLLGCYRFCGGESGGVETW